MKWEQKEKNKTKILGKNTRFRGNDENVKNLARTIVLDIII